MTFFRDLNNFLEQRLEDFIRANPQLELNLLLMEIEDQERQTQDLYRQLQQEVQECEQHILQLVTDIRRWRDRIQTATAAGRPDLVTLAQQREAQLRQRGQQLWTQRLNALKQQSATQELLAKIRDRRQELQRRVPRASTPPPPPPSPTPSATDPLEAEFRRLELQIALEELKRSMGR
ncbi:TIGR04376 family protein [Thermosynechococcaceae cyanobacterium Okahandja]